MTYGRMIKFSHTIFALPFALSAVVLASREHTITFMAIFWILIAMIGARSAAMGFNRIADVRFDAKNPRTSQRAIPAGKLSKASARLFVVLSSGLFIFASAMLGRLCFYFSFPVLLFIFQAIYLALPSLSWFYHITGTTGCMDSPDQHIFMACCFSFSGSYDLHCRF